MKYYIFYITLITIMIFLSSCTKKKVDLIVHNAKVYTVNEDFEIVEAFAVKDHKFVAIGRNENILTKYTSESIIDLEAKCVYPGFIDAHCHFYGYGYNLLKRVDLVGTKSFDEVVKRLNDHYEKHQGDWIEGRGWDQNDWSIKEFPDKDLLDENFPDVPVYLTRIDGHAAIANSRAFELAGITNETKIDGGELILKDGKLTGVLIDNAMDLVSNIIPESSETFNKKALLEAQKNCFKVGLTSVVDAGLKNDIVELIDEMHGQESLKMKINAMLSPTKENFDRFVKNGPYVTNQLTVRSIKLYADGALGSRGAKMIEPYSDDAHNVGLFVKDSAFYAEVCQLAYDNNYQVNTHAIGDEGNRFILKMYGEFLKGKNDRRWRIEHAQIIHPDDFNLFDQFSIIPSVQPTHATSDMYWAEQRVGAKRIIGAYAYKQLLEQNDWIPLGTDFPVEDINPLLTFYAAVSRTDIEGWPEGGFQIENSLTRVETLKGMTIWAAKGSFEEDVKGSIEIGKFADFVVLQEDLMDIDMSRLPSAHVIQTYLSGEEVYSIK